MVPKECQSIGARSGNTSRFRLNSIRACSLVSGLLSSWIHVYTCVCKLSHKRTKNCISLIPRPPFSTFSHTASGKKPGEGAGYEARVTCTLQTSGFGRYPFEVLKNTCSYAVASFSGTASEEKLGARLHQKSYHVDQKLVFFKCSSHPPVVTGMSINSYNLHPILFLLSLLPAHSPISHQSHTLLSPSLSHHSSPRLLPLTIGQVPSQIKFFAHALWARPTIGSGHFRQETWSQLT